MLMPDFHAEPSVETPLTVGPAQATAVATAVLASINSDEAETPCLADTTNPWHKTHRPDTSPPMKPEVFYAEPSVPITGGPSQDTQYLHPHLPMMPSSFHAKSVRVTGPTQPDLSDQEDGPSAGDSEPDSLDLRIAMQFQEQPLQPSEIEIFEATGTIPGFVTKRPASAPLQPTPQKKPKVTDTTTVHEEPDFPQELPVLQVVDQDSSLHTVKMMPPTKVAQVLQAERQLHGTNVQVLSNLVGIPKYSADTLKHDEYVSLVQPPQQATDNMPVLFHGTREELLWNQQDWVATDEMDYYMNFVESSLPSSNCGIMSLHNNPEDRIRLARHITKMILVAASDINTECARNAVLFDHHWIPIVVKASQDSAQVWTPADASWIRQNFTDHVGDHEVQFSHSVMPTVFAHDCGFQAIGWILSVAMSNETSMPVCPATVSHWRSLFHAHLIAHAQHQICPQQPLQLGGTSFQEQLTQLVQEHGVNSDRAAECASQLISQLGFTAVTQVLKSPRPWADLKSKANLARPPIKIV